MSPGDVPWHVPGCNCPVGASVCSMAPTFYSPRHPEPAEPMNRRARRQLAAINRRLERRALGRALGGSR